MPLPERRGMTLLEVMAALMIGGLVLSGGVLLLNQVNDDSARVIGERWSQAYEGNTYGTAKRLLSEATPSFDSTRVFRGDARSLDFFTRCRTPAGWTELCHVTFAIDSIRDSTLVMAQFDDGDQFAVRRAAGGMSFRFIDYSSPDSSWVATWSTSTTLPSALAIVSTADTVLFPIGPSRD